MAISASLAACRAPRWLPSTIHTTVKIRAPVKARNSAVKNAASRSALELTPLMFGNQAISDAADGLNRIDREMGVQMGAQAADMAFDHIGVRVEMNVPDVLQQHLSSHRAVHIAHEIFEQPEFLRNELDDLPFAAHRALNEVHLERARAEPGDGRSVAPSGDRPYPCQQLHELERLDQIIVAAGLEA